VNGQRLLFANVYGFPNDNDYPVFRKAKLMRDIGKLSTYYLPYRIGGIIPKLKFLNVFLLEFL